MKKHTKYLIITALPLILMAGSGKLYPPPADCNTTTVSYTLQNVSASGSSISVIVAKEPLNIE